MAESSSHFDIDAAQRELLSRGGVEAICQFYGVDPGELLKRAGDIRSKCFLACGKETGGRALSFDASKPRFHCYEYGCGKSGNLVTLCGHLKFGESLQTPVRGEQFRAIRDDIRSMLGGSQSPAVANTAPATVKKTEEPVAAEVAGPVRRNTPLKDADKEAARALVSLDDQFLVMIDEKMNRHAARYLRARPYLTPDVCRQHRCGYLPSSAKSLLRGKFVYPVLDVDGDVLTWFGRDPEFERKKQKWEQAGRPADGEPVKHRFVKGFHRGLEVLGQHEWGDSEVQQRIRQVGALLIVEGPNDRIALSALEVPAFAICGNQVTKEQAVKIAAVANEIGVPVGLMLDCDAEGYRGAVASLPILAEHAPVWFAWSPTSHSGHFRDWQPERLHSEPEAWATIASSLGGEAGEAGREE